MVTRASRLDSHERIPASTQGERSSSVRTAAASWRWLVEVDPMEDRPMFSVAPSLVQISCTYDWRFGWSARLSVPLGSEGHWLAETYGPCSPEELVDAVAGALAAALSNRSAID
jgi:hypothetical protein